MPSTPRPTEIGGATSPLTSEIRSIVPSLEFVTQMYPSPTAIAPGQQPTGCRLMIPPVLASISIAHPTCRPDPAALTQIDEPS
jgi:hypothetical protein